MVLLRGEITLAQFEKKIVFTDHHSMNHLDESSFR